MIETPTYGGLNHHITGGMMPKSEQGALSDRYAIIPRTLIFITRPGEILLLKGAPTKIRLLPHGAN
jgi:hypothetical protein